MGCRVVVSDVSPVQLALNERCVGDAGYQESVRRAIPMYAANGRMEALRQVMSTGDNRLDEGSHPCRMFAGGRSRR